MPARDPNVPQIFKIRIQLPLCPNSADPVSGPAGGGRDCVSPPREAHFGDGQSWWHREQVCSYSQTCRRDREKGRTRVPRATPGSAVCGRRAVERPWGCAGCSWHVYMHEVAAPPGSISLPSASLETLQHPVVKLPFLPNPVRMGCMPLKLNAI